MLKNLRVLDTGKKSARCKRKLTIGHFRTPTSRTIGHPCKRPLDTPASDHWTPLQATIGHPCKRPLDTPASDHWTLSEGRFKPPLDTYAGFWYSGLVNTSRNPQGRFSRKLDAKDIAAIRAMHAEGASIREIADFLSLPKSTVHWTLKQDESAPAE